MTQDLEFLAAQQPGHALRPLWHLETDCHFLNHGSYGATPRHVLAAQDAWRLRMERQPVRFMGDELPEALRSAASRLAEFLGTAAQRIALVENATGAVNAVLRSVRWEQGDEIVLANHAYPAVQNTVAYLARRHGPQLPLPLQDPQQLVQAYCDAITPRTRVAIVDHVFSSLAVVTPLEPIVEHCQRQGVAVLIDGAHGPGMLELELDALGADWYVGNCHKWLFAPKGSAFLYAGPGAAQPLHPCVISNFHGAGFPQEFDWQGTRDYSGWLAIPAALDFLQAFGAQRYRQLLREQASQAAALLCERWAVELPAPAAAFAAMVTLPCPAAEEATAEGAKRCHDRLWSEHRVEVPVLPSNGRLWLRISAQIYNELSDFEALALALM